MAERESIVGFEDRYIPITLELARKFKGRLLGIFGKEGTIDEVKLMAVSQRCGLSEHVDRVITRGLELGKGKYLRCKDTYQDVESGEKRYHFKVVTNLSEMD